MRRALVAVAVSVVMLSWGSTRAMAVCGDGVKDADEDCDLGGSCIGGSKAGTACHVGDTTCTDGTCTTFGGKGCAANCTTEHDVPYPLVPGQLDGLNLLPGTSGVAIASDFLSIPLPLGPGCNGGDNAGNTCTTDADCPGGTCVPAAMVLTVGKEKDGKIPVVVKASNVKFPGIPVSTLACGCVHGVSSKTCGGTFFEADGKTLSDNCTPGFSDGDSVCAGKAPCAFVHGDGNTAAGEIGCAAGLDNINLSFSQDSGGSSGPCAAPNTCPPTVLLSGHGGPGSALVFQTLGVTAALGGCTGSDPSTYGPDGVLCTDDDPSGGIIAVAGTLPVTTGNATAVVHNANGSDGTDLGPVTADGKPYSCTQIAAGTANGGVVGAFTFVHLDTVGDVAVSAQLFSEGGGGTPCAGDCDASGDVTVDEVVKLVNLALEVPGAAACSGAPSPVEITYIIQAVGFALNNCPA